MLLEAMFGAALAHPFAEDAIRAAPPSCVDGGMRWLEIARAWTEEGQHDEATTAIDRADACGMDPVLVTTARALLAVEQQDPAQALPLLDEALQVNPLHLGLRLARARTLARLGLHEAASEDWAVAFERMERPSPDDVLRWTRLLMEGGQPRKALAVLDEAIERVGPAPGLVRAAIEAEMALGWTTAARGRLEGLPDTSFWAPLRSEVLLRTGAEKR